MDEIYKIIINTKNRMIDLLNDVKEINDEEVQEIIKKTKKKSLKLRTRTNTQ